MRDRAIEANTMLLTQVKLEIDGRIDEIHRMFDQISVNPEIRTVTAAKQNGRTPRPILVVRTIGELSRLRLLNSFIDDIFIYYPQTDTVFTGVAPMNFDLFYRLNLNSIYGPDALREMLSGSYFRYSSPVYTLDGTYIFFMHDYILPGFVPTEATIIISVREEVIRASLENITIPGESMAQITDGSGRLISAVLPTDSPPRENYENYHIISMPSALIDWEYTLFIPNHIFYEHATMVQLQTIIALLLSVVICSIAMYFFAKMNYSPVKALLEAHSDAQLSLYRNEQILKSRALSRILKGHDDMEDAQKLYNLALPGEYYCVILFLINESEMNLELSQFAVLNIFSDLAAPHFPLETCEIDEFAIAILSYPNTEDEYLEKCEEIAYTVLSQVKEHFDMDIIVAIGGAKEKDLRASFLEAMEAAEYRNTLGEREVIHYSDIKKTGQEKNAGLSQKVIDYVAEHYNNSNVNVSSIGETFDLTPAYLSKLFKEQTGEGLLSYLNAVRVDAAKKLLQEGKSVNEVAAMVGFTNSGTMIRIFKKIVGITPGQIRNED